MSGVRQHESSLSPLSVGPCPPHVHPPQRSQRRVPRWTWSPMAVHAAPQSHASPKAIHRAPCHPQAVTRGAPPDPWDLPAAQGPAGLLLLWPLSRDHVGSVLVLITRHAHLLPCIHHCQEHYPLNKAHPPYYSNVNSEPLR